MMLRSSASNSFSPAADVVVPGDDIIVTADFGDDADVVGDARSDDVDFAADACGDDADVTADARSGDVDVVVIVVRDVDDVDVVIADAQGEEEAFV